MIKKFLSALLAVIMVVSMIPVAAMAEGETTKTGPVGLASILAPGSDNAEYDNSTVNVSGNTVKLLKAISITNGVRLVGATSTAGTSIPKVTLSEPITLDLNGQTLTVPTDKYFLVQDGAKLIVDDSTEGKAGKLTYTAPQSGTTKNAALQIQANGTVEVKGGTVEGPTAIVVPESVKGANVTLSGGKLVASGATNGNAGIFVGTSTDENAPHVVTVTGGEIDSKSYGIVLRDKAKLTVSGTTAKIKGVSYGISTNGSDRNTQIEVLGGTVESSSEAGIYAPAPVGVTIENATVKGVTAGIVVRGANLTVKNGANISVTGSTGAAAGDATETLPPSAIVLDHIGGGYEKGSVTITGGTISATSEKAAVSAVNNAASAITITGGTFSSDPFAQGTGITSATHIAVVKEGKYVVVNKAGMKEELITAIKTAMESDTAGAPLHDTRLDSDDTKADGVANEDLYSSYSVAVAATPASGSDLTLNVTAKELKAHQNDADPKSMGCWVGVKFPYIEGWTISRYKRDKVDEVTSITPDTDENGKQTLNAYYDVGDTSEKVENPRLRPVVVTYKNTATNVEVPVKFQVDLTGVVTYIPKAQPIEGGGLSEKDKNDLTAAIGAAATGNSTNEDTTVADTKPTVSVGTTGDGTVKIPGDVVNALKGTVGENKTPVDLKIGDDSKATVTIPAETVKDGLTDSTEATVTVTKTEGKPTITEGSDDKNVASAALADNVETTVTVEVKEGSTAKFDSDVGSDAKALTISVKVSQTLKEYFVLYLNSGVFQNMGKVKSNADGIVNFKSRHLSSYSLIQVNANSIANVAKLETSASIPDDQKDSVLPEITYTLAKDITGADRLEYYIGNGKLSLKNKNAWAKRYMIAIGPNNSTKDAFNLTFVKKVEAGGTFDLPVQKSTMYKVYEVPMDQDLATNSTISDPIIPWTAVSTLIKP